MSLGKGVVRDDNLDYLLKRVYIYAKDFVTGLATTSNVNSPSTLTCGFANTAATVPTLVDVGGNRRQAVSIATTAATLQAIFSPSDMDNRWPLYVRYHWSASTTTAIVATFNTFWSGGTADVVTATPSTALSVQTVSVGKSTTEYTRTLTRWGHIGALGTGAYAYETVPATCDEIAFNVALSTVSGQDVTVAGNAVFLYKMELAYTPRATFGDGSGREARYMNEILAIGPQEAGPTVSNR